MYRLAALMLFNGTNSKIKTENVDFGGHEMKKNICALLVGLLVFTLCACSRNKQSAMYIKPSEFSDETMEVLELFDDEIQFFYISFDETVKSYAIVAWIYRNGEWVEGGMTGGNTDHLTRRIAVRLTETGYDIYTVDESGYVKYSVPISETPFDESMGIGGTRIDREIPIELNKEIPIWVKIGTTTNSMKIMGITDDFRNAECNAGIAITLTASDKVIE
jgi:hypothetical protein